MKACLQQTGLHLPPPPETMQINDLPHPEEGSGAIQALLSFTNKWTGEGSMGWECSVNTSLQHFKLKEDF